MLCCEGTDIWNRSELNLQPLVRVTRRLFRPSFNLLDGRTILSSSHHDHHFHHITLSTCYTSGISMLEDENEDDDSDDDNNDDSDDETKL